MPNPIRTALATAIAGACLTVVLAAPAGAAVRASETGGAAFGSIAAKPEAKEASASAKARSLPAAPSARERAILERIAECESGGDPEIVSANGMYRGKYQFSRSTWAAMGGAGDPAAAPEAEQDRRAAKLMRQQGVSPWPHCGPRAL